MVKFAFGNGHTHLVVTYIYVCSFCHRYIIYVSTFVPVAGAAGVLEACNQVSGRRWLLVQWRRRPCLAPLPHCFKTPAMIPPDSGSSRARGAPDRTHQASCCPRQPLAGMLSGGHPAPHLPPSYALASPSRRPRAALARLRRGRTPATSCLPRGPLADPLRDPRGPGTPRRSRNQGGQQVADSGVVWA